MEMIEWQKELIKQAEVIMLKGGELIFKVEKRGPERVPEIFIYPDNKIRCKSEFLIE